MVPCEVVEEEPNVPPSLTRPVPYRLPVLRVVECPLCCHYTDIKEYKCERGEEGRDTGFGLGH